MFINKEDEILNFFILTPIEQEAYRKHLDVELIESYGGKVLSYIDKHVTIICQKGHEYTIIPYVNKITKGCPHCKKSRWTTETKVRELLETKLNITLSKQRFKCLTKSLEFDGYNEHYKIAFEYNGKQHYNYPNHWHKTYDKFLKQQENDRLKVQYCLDNGIRLITIPYTVQDLESYIQHIEL